MADLNFLERSNPVQIVGGNEQFAASVSPRNDLAVNANIREELTGSSLVVGLTPVEIKTGASRLANRQGLFLYNNSSRTMYWGDSTVTTLSGIPLVRGSFAIINIEDVPVFVVSDQASQNARVVEFR